MNHIMSCSRDGVVVEELILCEACSKQYEDSALCSIMKCEEDVICELCGEGDCDDPAS